MEKLQKAAEVILSDNTAVFPKLSTISHTYLGSQRNKL